MESENWVRNLRNVDTKVSRPFILLYSNSLLAWWIKRYISYGKSRTLPRGQHKNQFGTFSSDVGCDFLNLPVCFGLNSLCCKFKGNCLDRKRLPSCPMGTTLVEESTKFSLVWHIHRFLQTTAHTFKIRYSRLGLNMASTKLKLSIALTFK